jgi:hypothetical protein
LILLYILTPSIPTTETTHGFCEEDFDEEIACQAQKVQAQGREETREAQSEEASREEARRQKARQEAPQEKPSQEAVADQRLSRFFLAQTSVVPAKLRALSFQGHDSQA